MTDSDSKAAAFAFLNEHTAGVLSTLSADGAPHARTIYYAADDAFAIYFMTLTGTRKIDDINGDGRAAFVVSSEDKPRTLQIEGTIANLTETATITPVVRRLSDIMQAKGFLSAPLTHLDPGHSIVFYKLTPTWVRFGDFTDGIGDKIVFTEIPV